MATSCGKKARRAGGTRFACKRAKAKRTGRRRAFGKLAYSVEAKNAAAVVEANDRVAYEAAAARRAKGFDPDANVAVGPGMPTRQEVDAKLDAEREATRKLRKQERKKADEADDEEDEG